VGNRAGADRYTASRRRTQAWEKEQRGPPREAGARVHAGAAAWVVGGHSKRGRLGASPHTDVEVLDGPFCILSDHNQVTG
jgi:hypothetical protein